jgi:hypothetical protein
MISDKNKIQLIHFIDDIKEVFASKISSIDDMKLNNLRKKYIYKDISKVEFIEDVKYLKKVDEYAKWSYYYNN